MRFSLYGILSKELITHFTLLSDAIYTLCKTRITKNEVLKPGSMLQKSADQFEFYYGKTSVTINVHLLRHYEQSVFNTGPLWCQSMFAYESNIGELKRFFNCNVDVVEQIAFNYCIKAASNNKSAENREESPKILRLKRRMLSSEQKNMLNVAGVDITGVFHKIGYEMFWRNHIYKSTAGVVTKSIDYFIKVTDGTTGCIEYFIELTKPCTVVKKYDVVKNYSHLIQVQPSHEKTHELYACDLIQQKLIYLKFTFSNVAFIEIITTEPNSFEGN